MRRLVGTIGMVLGLAGAACGGGEDGGGAAASGGAGGASGASGASSGGAAAGGASGAATGGASGAAGAGGAATGGAGGAGGGAGAGGGQAGAGAGGGGGLPETQACSGQSMLQSPEDPAARGPWPVGSRLIDVGGLTAEVWYPATPGSEAGKAEVRYDPREWLPASEQSKIPDADNPYFSCDGCYRDLPLDTAHGPYPVVIFVHGTGAFRAQSIEPVVHWASRGFVVLAADHPGLYLGDLLSFQLQQNLSGDIIQLFGGLNPPAGDLAFLAGRLDLAHMGMSGHSAGGGAIANQGSRPGVLVLMPLAARGVAAGSSLVSTLVMGGMSDGVAQYSGQVSGYDSSPTKKRLVGITDAGHLAFSNLCEYKNSQGKDFVEVAQQYQIQNANLASFLWDGCDPTDTPEAESMNIVRFATTAVLEETLLCYDRAAALAGIEARYPLVGEYREAL
ncbi:MAG: hypothetical protein IT376_01880 [Polyangiaceae bacterium]|nr:hypothetical protein [Polyangiaceae bacterium]